MLKARYLQTLCVDIGVFHVTVALIKIDVIFICKENKRRKNELKITLKERIRIEFRIKINS